MFVLFAFLLDHMRGSSQAREIDDMGCHITVVNYGEPTRLSFQRDDQS
jgi:hypothetical protein